MSIEDRAMLVRLSISQWTARKYDKKASKEVAASHQTDDNVGRYNKQLIAKVALDEITKIINAARTFHYEQTLPWWDDGARLLPSSNYFDYNSSMRSYHDQFEIRVTKFFDAYPQYLNDARVRLKSLFDPNDYPSVDSLRDKFAFNVDVMPVPSAKDFRVDLGEHEISRIQKQLSERLSQAQNTAMEDLWKRVHTTVSRIQDRLSDPKAVFRDSLIENARELVSLLPKLNMTNDPELEKVRQEIEKKLCQHDPAQLRNNQGARKNTANAADDILAVMGGYMGAA